MPNNRMPSNHISGNHIRGVIAPFVTPFTADYTVDESLFCEFAAHLLDSGGCDGLVAFGTTSEAASISVSQKISAMRALAASGVPTEKIMLGAGLNDLWGTIELCRLACDLNCQGVLLLPPAYYKIAGDDGLFDYFTQLIRLVERDNLRIYLYHIPQVAGVGFSIDLARRLRQSFPDIIVGIKDSSGDYDNSFALMEIDGLATYPGSELYFWESLRRGAMGCITASANLNASMIGEMVRRFDSGDEDLQALFDEICQFRKALQAYPLIAAIKGLLSLQDERWKFICPPLTACAAEDIAALQVSIGHAKNN